MRNRQLDLFGSKANKEKSRQREGIVIPVDATILILVVIILLLVLFFSWGVERGRKLTLKDFAIENEPQKISLKMSQEEKFEPLLNKPIENEADSNIDKKEEETEKDKKNKPVTSRYRVQVATFHKLSSAREEAKKLEKEGFPVEIETKSKYSVVYVGSFEDKSEAENNFKKLKNTYQDCILRSLNP